MPRLANTVPKYRKHKATGQAFVELNGHRHYLGLHGSKASRVEYDRLIAEWLSSGRANTFGTPTDAITVVELVVAYMAFSKRYHGGGKRGTHANMKRPVRTLRKLYGRTLAAEFGVQQFKAVRQTLLDENLSRTYINETMRRVVTVFRWAAAEGLIAATVPQNLSIIPGLRKGRSDARETAPIMPVDDATVEATLEHLPAIPADMVRLQRLTGMRPAEVCILRPCDLDRSGDVWLYLPKSHKTEYCGRERVIFIGPQSQGVLLRYLVRDSRAYCFSPRDSEQKRLAEQTANRKTPLSCGHVRGSNRKKKPKRKPGERYDTNAYRRAVHRACDKAGVERWSPNRLRHSAATEIRREFGLEAAQVILGHSQANVTQVYAERDLAKGLEVAKRIG